MVLKIADFFIGPFSGAVMAFCIHFMVGPDLNMLFGMVFGGLIGMGLMLLLMIALMPFCGAFEVMIPLHLNAMLVGMSAGMLSTLPSTALNHLTLGGAVVGLLVSLYIYFSNKRLTQS